MKYWKFVAAILYTLVLFFTIAAAYPAKAIVVVVPVILGVTQIIGLVIAIASLPVTLISVFINIDKYKSSKKKFFLLALATWLAIIAIIAMITSAIYYLKR